MDIKPSHRPGQQAFGPWGEHTSTLDWCEDNYVDFIYIAETWNALSNIPFILLALHGMITTLQERMPNKARYALAHAMIAFIGIGSFLFHSTLMWTAQVLLDELPMIYVSFQVLYCLLLEGRPSPSATYSTRILGIHVGVTEAKLLCVGLPTLITLNAGGLMDSAGPYDQTDLSYVIDYVINRTDWQVDKTKIAFCGISYGAGISLFAASIDPRVSAVFSMSGWGSMTDSLYTENTPNLFWGSMLLAISKFVSHPDPSLQAMWHDMLRYQNISAVLAWSDNRSTITLAQNLMKKNIPVFMSHNLEDGLFKAQFVLEYFDLLTNPKMILLNQGAHGTAEMGGLLDVPNNYIWLKAKAWADYWLLGIQNNITADPQVQWQPRGADQNTRIMFQTWPASNIQYVNYYLTPRTTFSITGGLQSTPYTGNATTNSFYFGLIDGLTLGIPVVADLAEAWVDIPVVSPLLMASRINSVVYMSSDVVQSETTICGTPIVNYTVTSNNNRWQVVSYLYAADELGFGTLLGHGVHTCWDCTPKSMYSVTNSMSAMCTAILPGFRIAIAFDMYSEIYEPATASLTSEVSITFDGNGGGPVLSIPFIKS
jgi:hypothetical protein